MPQDKTLASWIRNAIHPFTRAQACDSAGVSIAPFADTMKALQVPIRYYTRKAGRKTERVYFPASWSDFDCKFHVAQAYVKRQTNDKTFSVLGKGANA